MNVIPFVQTNTAARYQTIYKPEFPKHSDQDERNRSLNVEESPVQSVRKWQAQAGPSPFKVFKTILRDDFNKWNTDFLAEYLMKTHHAFAKTNVLTIHGLAQKVAYRHCENHPELLTLIEVIFLFQHDLLNQMKKEEQTIYPYLKQKDRSQLKNDKNMHSAILIHRMKWMKYENDKALEYLKVLRQVTYNFGTPSDACESYKALFQKLQEFEEDLQLHIYLENEILFPRIVGSPN
ncbi:MAG: hemerythrin domain-containing protein [Ginsengibacter sp.]